MKYIFDREPGVFNLGALCVTLGSLLIAFFSPPAKAQMVYHRDRGLEVLRRNTCGAAEYLIIYGEGLRQYQQGQFSDALATFQIYQNVANHRTCGDNQEQEIIALNRLGLVYESLGRYKRAQEEFEKAEEINRAYLDDKNGLFLQGIILNNLGLVLVKLGQYEDAIKIFEEARKIHQKNNFIADEGASYTGLGLAYFELGQYQNSLISYQQAQAKFSRERQDIAEGVALNGMGNAYVRLGDYILAMESFQKALTIYQNADAVALEGLNHSDRGRAFLSMGNLPDAENELWQAITILESLRTDLDDINQISIFDTQASAYKQLQYALVAQTKIEAGLEISERGRARATIKLLADKISDRLAQKIATDAPEIDEIQRIAQEQNATLVNYSILDNAVNGPTLYIWVVQPDGTLHFESVALNQIDQPLAELVATTRQSMGIDDSSLDRSAVIIIKRTPEAKRRQEAQQRSNLQALHRLLIDPIAPYLPTDADEKVIFIPQGELFSVPFPALMDTNSSYLIERHTLLTAPSIQVLDLTRQQRQDPSQPETPLAADDVLIVGNPDMPSIWDPATQTSTQLSALQGALNEAFAIADLFNTEPLTWGDASETAVVNKMIDARVIHLATHGLLEYGIPEDSGVQDFPGAIALAPDTITDGFLTSGEIFDLNLKADLVVLSACDTGQGRITGDGVIGLSRAFITAGTPSLIVSLWAVDDKATEELMQEFYRLWQDPEQSLDKAQALRQAMLTTMKSYPDPRLWSAFTLIGDAQ